MSFRRGRRSSLRSRLLRQLSLGAAIASLLAWGAHGAILQNFGRSFLGDRLAEEVRYLSERLRSDGFAAIRELAGESYFNDVFHHQFVVRLGDVTIGSYSLPASALSTMLQNETPGLRELDAGGDHLLAYRQTVPLPDGRKAMVMVAESYSSLDHALTQLHWWTGGIGAVLFASLLVMNLRIVDSVLRPLGRLRRQIDELQAGRRSDLDTAVPPELGGLVRALNELVTTQRRRLKRSREAIANLSHALKTPLAGIYQVLFDNRPPDRSTRGALREALTGVMARLDAELHRARIAGPGTPGHRCRPAAQADALVRVLRGLYPDHEVALNSTLQAAYSLPMDAHDFDELLGNLADNACKWARREVRIRLRQEEAGVLLRVENDGEPPPPETLAALSDWGRRLDTGKPGHGLGLYLVEATVADYGGQIRFDISPLGGLGVTAILPDRRAVA